ncbi:hypothetical protein BKA62DRAFT_677582 [Auriculariales sp. MPI-PUGE-AT-0066]|nr:hypothetical protein BKA62DRAFT_677582 [Auriculariales sp. MPI-PUGE-AT-0066]
MEASASPELLARLHIRVEDLQREMAAQKLLLDTARREQNTLRDEISAIRLEQAFRLIRRESRAQAAPHTLFLKVEQKLRVSCEKKELQSLRQVFARSESELQVSLQVLALNMSNRINETMSLSGVYGFIGPAFLLRDSVQSYLLNDAQAELETECRIVACIHVRIQTGRQ